MRGRAITMIGLVALIPVSVPGVAAFEKSGILKATTVIGMTVQGADGKRLGDIKDLVIDPMDGSIGYVVLDFGGFLGLGEKYFAVPWEALQWADDPTRLILDVNSRDLRQAPGFDKNNWPDLGSEE